MYKQTPHTYSGLFSPKMVFEKGAKAVFPPVSESF